MGVAALTGLITGFAKAESERIDKEREDQETLMLNRLKLAAANKKQIEEEGVKLKEAAKSRYDFVETNFVDATEQQKIAIASNPFLISQLKAKIEARESVTKEDLDKFIIANTDKIKWKTAKEYYESLAQPSTVTPIQTVGEQTGRLGERISPKPSKLASMAATFGAKSPEELLAYESAKRPEAPEVLGSMRAGFLVKKEKEKSIDTQIEEEKAKGLAALEQFGENSDQYKASVNRVKLMTNYKENFEETDATLEKKLQRLEVAEYNETDPEKKKQLGVELKALQTAVRVNKMAISIKDTGEKEKTYSQIKASINDYVANNMRDDRGFDWKKYVDFKKYVDPATKEEFVYRTIKENLSAENQRLVFEQERKLQARALVVNGYIGKDGQARYPIVQEIMNNFLLTPEHFKNASAAPSAAPSASKPTSSFKEVKTGRTVSGFVRPAGVGPNWIIKEDAKGNIAWVSPDGKYVEIKK